MDLQKFINNIGSAAQWFNPQYAGNKIGSAVGNWWKQTNLNPQVLGTKIGTEIGSSANAINDMNISRQEAFNSAEAQKQRDWEEQMSNTEVQRRVADINAAGLNPWLALNGGSVGAASTPSGASASSNSAFAANYANVGMLNILVKAITSLANSGLQAASSIAKTGISAAAA